MDKIVDFAQVVGNIIAAAVLSIYFAVQYIKKTNAKVKIGKTVIEQTDISLEIYQTMNYYKELLKADRILLFEFHNGQHYSNYRSAIRMSASYEVYRAGLESVLSQCTNLPITIMPRLIKGITTQDYVYCQDIERIKGDMGSCYEFKKGINVHSYFDIALKDQDGFIIGFVAVHWNNPIPSHVHLEEDYKDELFHLSWKLEELVKELTIADKKAKK